MQTPVEIGFQGMSRTPEVLASIQKHVGELSTIDLSEHDVERAAEDR